LNDVDEDDELQRALALSMAAPDSAPAASFADQSFVNELLNNSDPELQAALEQIRKQDEEQAAKEKDDKNKKRKNDDL
jgi:hypothetical protein